MCIQPLIESKSRNEPKEKIFLVQHPWSRLEVQKLKAGVRQKNLEAMAEPIRDRCQGSLWAGAITMAIHGVLICYCVAIIV